MRKANDLVGKRFGRLYVIHRAVKKSHIPGAEWVCICDCGTVTTVHGRSLVQETTRSCGCLRKEMTAKRAKEMYRLKREKRWREYAKKHNTLPYNTGTVHSDFDSF